MFQYIENLSEDNRLLKNEVVRLKARVEELQLLNAELWTRIQKQIMTQQIDDPNDRNAMSTIVHDHPAFSTVVTNTMSNNMATDTYVLVGSPDKIIDGSRFK